MSGKQIEGVALAICLRDPEKTFSVFSGSLARARALSLSGQLSPPRVPKPIPLSISRSPDSALHNLEEVVESDKGSSKGDPGSQSPASTPLALALQASDPI